MDGQSCILRAVYSMGWWRLQAVTVIGPVTVIASYSNFTGNGVLLSDDGLTTYPRTTSGGAVWMTGLADGVFEECLFAGNGALVNGEHSRSLHH